MPEFTCLPSFVNCGSVTYPPGGSFGPRLQPTYQLVMILSGRVELTEDDEVTQHEAGMTIFLTPGHCRFYQFATDQPTHHSWINIDYKTAPASTHDLLERLPRSIPLSQRMIDSVREMEQWSNSPQRDVMLPAIGHYVISLYMSEAQGSINNSQTPHETVMLAERYIRQNYRIPFSLADLAANASVSPEHLCRLFQENRQKSPMAYVWEVRTEHALRLLASTGLSVASVADRCGFKNPIHLHRRIKAKTGLSPTEYRHLASVMPYRN